MTEFVTCASCGARNGTESVWCTQCFEPLHPPEPESPTPETGEQTSPAPEPNEDTVHVTLHSSASASPETPSEEVDTEARVDDSAVGESTWTCTTCHSVNPISEDVCSVCGTTIFQTMGAESEEITLSQDQGILLGLVPGLAHARLGEPVVGFIVALLVLACLAFGFVFISSGGPLWGIIVGLVGLLTWGVSIFDVNQRIAGAAPILRPRVMTILGGVVILLIMVAGFVAGANAVRTPGS